MRLQLLKVDVTRPRLGLQDLRAACGVFLLVVLATFPRVIPFIYISETALALRVSNGVAVVMLFFSGLILGHHAGGSPWRYGLTFTIIGVVLINSIVALGG
jgi:VIT1/CCC1 family predicted Fe2+/Mn2+ transporter